MQVLLVLFGSLLFYRALGVAGVSLFVTWMLNARLALATMFVFTAMTAYFRVTRAKRSAARICY